MTEPLPLRARYTGYVKDTENHGDEALIWIIRDLLSPDLDVVTEGDEFDVALLGGGTLINQSPWLIDLFARHLDRARHGIVFGTGVGDPLFWGKTFDRWNPLLERCAHVGVRGPESARLLKANGFTRAEMIGDPYLALRPPMEYRPRARTLGVNFGVTNNSLLGGYEAAFLSAVRSLLQTLRREGWSFVWVSVWSRDLEVMRSIRNEVGEDSGPLLDARSMTLETLSAIAGCELFLGEKLHALAMSAVAGIPFIAWEYQPKVRDFAESVGMGNHVLSTADRTTEIVIRRIDQLRLDREKALENLRRETTARRESILAFARRVRQWARGVSV